MKKLLTRYGWTIAAVLVLAALILIFQGLRSDGTVRLVRMKESGDAALVSRIRISGLLASRGAQAFAQNIQIDAAQPDGLLQADLQVLSDPAYQALTFSHSRNLLNDHRAEAIYTISAQTVGQQNHLTVIKRSWVSGRESYASLPVDLKSSLSASATGARYDPWYAINGDMKSALAWIDGTLYGVAPAGEGDSGSSALFRINHWRKDRTIETEDASQPTCTELAKLSLDQGWRPLALFAYQQQLALVSGTRNLDTAGQLADGYSLLAVDLYDRSGQLQQHIDVDASFYNIQSITMNDDTLCVTTGGDELASHLFTLSGPAAYWGKTALEEPGQTNLDPNRLAQILDGHAYLLDVVRLHPIQSDDLLSIRYQDGFVLKDLPWTNLENATYWGRTDLRLTVVDQSGQQRYQVYLDCGLNDDLFRLLSEGPYAQTDQIRQIANLVLEEVPPS